MKAHGHVLSGAAAGAALIPWAAPGGDLVQQGAWTAACAGFALLPDLDARGTTAARMWGPLSTGVAVAVGWVARGHRQGTHDAVLAPLAFGALAWAASGAYWATLTLLAVAIGLALRGLHVAISGHTRTTAAGNLALSWGAAWLLLDAGVAAPAWLPAAVAAGIVAHVAGDALTPERVPVPLVWLVNRRARVGVPLFTTGKGLEPAVTSVIGAAAAVLFTWRTGLVDWPAVVAYAAGAAGIDT